jgi:hypothetical protein
MARSISVISHSILYNMDLSPYMGNPNTREFCMKKKIPRTLFKKMFDNDTVFGHKIERDRTKYKRKDKYKVNNYEQTS